jgi:hypothetical protein
MVWSGNGTPFEEPIFTSKEYKNEQSGFVSYNLDTNIVLPSGDFFIGFYQSTDEYLNIGFDQNNNAENAMFYYDNGSSKWMPIYYYGAVMMHPVLGSKTTSNIASQTNDVPSVSIYPNPTNGEFYISSQQRNITAYEIFDIKGQLITRTSVVPARIQSCNRHLNKGLYFVKVYTENEEFEVTKLLIK